MRRIWASGVVGRNRSSTSRSSCVNSDCGRYGLAVAIRKLDAKGASLLVSKIFGGGFDYARRQSFTDAAFGVAFDQNDSAWIVGGDQSGGVPTTVNAIAANRPSAYFAGYAVKMSLSGELLYASYIDGYSQDPIRSVAVDGSGNPYFSLVNSSLESHIIAFAADGVRVILSKQFGSAVGSIALDGGGGLYAVGTPGPAALACPTTSGAYQFSPRGNDSIICAAKFDLSQSTTSQLF